MAEVLTPNRLDQRLRLPDGRWLGFAEYGRPDGKPVFFFHGLPGSRIVADSPQEDGTAVRTIAIDRPGIGLSTYQHDRHILDWPADVAALADALGWDRFAVYGGSGGGPYVLACAHQFPERITHALVLNGMAPLDRPNALAGYEGPQRTAWRMATAAPKLFAAITAQGQWFYVRFSVSRLVRRMTANMAKADQELVRRQAEMHLILVRHVTEAYRQGWRGVAREYELMVRPWGFSPADIPIEVNVWQGEDDRNVPREMGDYLASTLPHSRFTLMKGQGHLIDDAMRGEIRKVLTGERGEADGS